MPGTSPEVKQVLLKWKVNTSDWKAALADITRQISEVRKSDAAARTQDKSYLDYKMKQIRLSIGDLRQEVAEKQKASKELLTQITQQKLIAAQAAARVAQERATTAEINRQTAALRQQLIAQRAAQGAGGGGGGRSGGSGGGGGFFAGFFGGLGSKFGGTLTSAVAQGELLAKVIEGLAEKVKRFVEESGPLAQVREQFEKLSALKGFEAVKFIEDLRNATHNLVGDAQLYRTANMAMQSGINLSQEQMVGLTQATVGLARAQGRDATQAVDALTRGLTTGRFTQLAYLTGISRTELTVRGLSATMSNHQRIQASFDQAYKVITKRFQEVGEPALTFTERLKQLDVISTRLFESFARGFTQSSGMRSFFEYLESVMARLNSGESGIEAFGAKVGSVLTVVSEVFKTLETVVSGLLTTIKELGGSALAPFSKLIEFFSGKSVSDDFISRMTTFTGLMKTAAEAVVLMRGAFKEIQLRAVYEAGKLIPSFGKGKRKTKDEHEADLKAAAEEEYSDIVALEKSFNDMQKKLALGAAGGKGTSGEEDSIALQRRLAQLKLQLARDTAKEILDVEKRLMQDEKDANEEAYQEGEKSLADYLAMKKTLREKELYVVLREIQQERDAEAANYLERLKSGQIQPAEYQAMMRDLAQKTQAKVVTSQTQEAKDQSALDRKAQKDVIEANRLRQQTSLETQRVGLQEEEALLEKSMKNGLVTVELYSQRKKAIWEEELRLFDQIEDLKAQGTAQSAKQQFQIEEAKAKQLAETRKKEAILQQELPDIEIQRSTSVFDKQLRVLEAQRAISRVAGGRTRAGTGPSIQDMISLHEKFIDQQAALMQTVDPTSDSFLKLAGNIAKSTAAIIELKHQLPVLQEVLGAGISSVGGAFGAFGAPREVTHYNPLTKMMGRTTVPAITQIQEAMGAAGAFETNQAKYVSYSRDAGISSNPMIALGSTFRGLVSSSKDMAANFDKFSQALTHTIDNIGTFSAALQGQGGPAKAGVTGALSGMSLGGQAGGLLEQLPGLFGMSTALAGPIGAAAGAAVGLISGIFGAKARKAAEQIAKQITDEINKSLKDYALQNATMAQTLQALQQERQQAVSQLSGKKGGRDQLDKILPQLDQQIQQLQQQQKQIMIQMDENLQVIGSAAPWQPLLSNIQSIIQQYRDYINAGGDVTKANQFLKDSFANMLTTDMSTLNQDMQDAIDNALQYNDLLLQRQQYINQTSQQIYDIMAAGAPARMRTQAQSKMAQIEQIQIQRDQQLAQMDEQIQVAGYKLNAEQKIFNLAQTRIGLEQQLAQLQMATIDQDMARIVALQQLVAALKGGSLIGAIGGAVTGSPTSGTAGLAAVLAALGLGPATSAVGGVSPNPHSARLDTSFSYLYGRRGRQGFGGFSGEL